MIDAKQLATVYHDVKTRDIYIIWVRNLCAAGKPEEATTALADLSNAEGSGICREALFWLESLMDNGKSEMESSDDEDQMSRFQWASQAAQVIAAKLHSMSQLSTTEMQEFRRVRSLFAEFNIAEVREELRSEQARMQIIERFAASLAAHGTDSLNPNDVRLMRLADILDLERTKLIGMLAQLVASHGKVLKAVSLCKEIFSTNGTAIATPIMLQVSRKLVKYLSKDLSKWSDEEECKVSGVSTFDCLLSERSFERFPPLPKNLFNWEFKLHQKTLFPVSISSHPIVSITALECLDVFKNDEIVHAMFQQSQSGDYEALVNRGRPSSDDMDVDSLHDDFGASLFQNNFSDNGLVFQTENAIPLAVDFAEGCEYRTVVKSAEGKSAKMADASQSYSGYELLTFLRTNRTLQLSLSAYQRVQEYHLRFHAPSDKDWSSDVDYFNGVLETLIGKVCSCCKDGYFSTCRPLPIAILTVHWLSAS